MHQTPTEVQIIGANGTILHSVPFDKSSKPAVSPFKKPGNSTSSSRRALPQGYIAYAYWDNPDSSPISDFATTWTVPPIPANTDGQLLYWFNALVPPSDDAILQPVLQFGVSPAGGGPYYSIASWYLINSNVYYSSLIQVQPGQQLTGYMILANTQTSGSTTQYDWAAYFGGYRDTILTAGTTEVLNWAYEALEIYNAQSDADLPTGSTEMSGISISYQNGQSPSSLPWTTVSDPSNGIFMSVISSSSVQITY